MMANDVEYCYVLIDHLNRGVFKYLTNLIIRLSSCYWPVRVLYILDTKPLLDIWFSKILSQSLTFLFSFSDDILWLGKHLNLAQNMHLIFFFSFIAYTSFCPLKKSAWYNSQRFSPLFFSRNLMVLAWTLKSMISFELIFLYGVDRLR